MPCRHDPLEVDIGLHVGVKEFLKIGVAQIADEIPVKLIDHGTSR